MIRLLPTDEDVVDLGVHIDTLLKYLSYQEIFALAQYGIFVSDDDRLFMFV